jgi:hypothetical protein
VNDLNWTARISVSDHAMFRARERLGWQGSTDEIAAAVRGEVREGILFDRVALRRPNWTRGNRRDGAQTMTRYVWCRQGTRCWVVLPSANGEAMIVKTLYVGIEEHVDTAEQRYVRHGMARR